MGRKNTTRQTRHHVRSGKGDKPIDLARIAEAMRGDKLASDAMCVTFTAQELTSTMKVGRNTANSYIRNAVEAGVVKYAGTKMVPDITGTPRRTPCYEYVGKEAK